MRHGGGTEGVGFQDVGAGFKILLVNLADHVGPGELQQLVVAFQGFRVVAETLAAIVVLAEPVALDHRAHRAVEDDDALAQDLGQPRAARVGGRVHWPIEKSSRDAGAAEGRGARRP